MLHPLHRLLQPPHLVDGDTGADDSSGCPLLRREYPTSSSALTYPAPGARRNGPLRFGQRIGPAELHRFVSGDDEEQLVEEMGFASMLTCRSAIASSRPIAFAGWRD